jgi:hypothetical protein
MISCSKNSNIGNRIKLDKKRTTTTFIEKFVIFRFADAYASTRLSGMSDRLGKPEILDSLIFRNHTIFNLSLRKFFKKNDTAIIRTGTDQASIAE